MSEDYLKDIQEIKQLMQDRSRFLSLSGMSGIMAGIYALIGAYIAYNWMYTSSSIAYHDVQDLFLSKIVVKYLILALIVLIAAIITAWYFTSKKAKKRNEQMWTKASYKALKSFLIPLATGGIFVLILLWKGELDLMASSCLIFYGLALYSASHYTLRDIEALGITEIVVGISAMFFTGYGLYFWAFGFGILHIIYGMIMHFKYDTD